MLGYLIDRARRMRRGGHSEASHIPGGGIVRELVFGANDGLVAAFAVGRLAVPLPGWFDAPAIGRRLSE